MDVYGVIGHPIGHSLSPPMHEAAFASHDLDARYVAFEPAPDAGVSAVKAAETLGIAGLNVTIPFKEDVLSYVDADDLAERVGAINTIAFDRTPPSGHNTDVEGAVRALEHHDVHIDGTTALVIGAGGAGRAIAFGLADRGAQVHVANRTRERAADIARDISHAQAHGLENLAALVENADIVVQATSVGMESDESLVPPGVLTAEQVIMDAVYRPLETRLLQDAEAAGAVTIDGAWMLLFQGAAAFERWTGRDAPIEAMNRAIRAEL